MPVGGVPAPPIPPLTGQPTREGLSMADYAAQQGMADRVATALRSAPLPSPPAQQPIFAADPPPPQAPAPPLFTQAPAPAATPMSRGILTTDLLPERAKLDSSYQQGMGSEFASNQPAMAMKYGVLRNGSHIPPQQLSRGRAGLSPQTLEGLNAVQRQMEDAHLSEQQPVEETAVGAAARLGGQSDVAAKDKKEALDSLDDFDWMRLRAVMSDMLGNEQQRMIVEERLEPLNIDDLIMLGYCTQEVPIVLDPVTREKRFYPTFRSTNAQVDFGLKMALMREAQNIKLRGAYFDDKFATMGACATTHMINGAPLPSMLDAEGNFNEEMFWVRFNKFSKLSVHTISSLGIHAFWFDMRVRALHKGERVKNG